MYSNVFTIYELSSAQQWHGISATFETKSSYCSWRVATTGKACRATWQYYDLVSNVVLLPCVTRVIF